MGEGALHAQAQAEKAAAKELLHQIVAMSGGRVEGATRLYKLFYFAHHAYMSKTGAYLTQYPIVKMPGGPGIHDAKSLIGEMIDERRINRSLMPTQKSDMHVFTLETPIEPPRDPARLSAIESALKTANGLYADQLSDLSHEMSRAWDRAEMGAEIDLPLDMVSAEELEKIEKSFASMPEDLVDALFG